MKLLLYLLSDTGTIIFPADVFLNMLTDLFVLDLANNHQGDPGHAEDIVNETARICNRHGIKAGIKFQFRDLKTFIHPDFHPGKSNPLVQRLLSTRLASKNFKMLFDLVKKHGLYTICTPFDETSVCQIQEFGFDIVKIASCSAEDWPLIKRIISLKKTTILSTGGVDFSSIDRVVNALENTGVDYAIMHCISIYPTPDNLLNLNRIDLLKKRYPKSLIGWSTHENPENLDAVKIAYGKGARVFERHIAINSRKYSINRYSSTPEQLDRWFQAYSEASKLCGQDINRAKLHEKERISLNNLRRGVFAKRKFKKGQTIREEDVFFAIPYHENGLFPSDFHNGLVVSRNYEKNEFLRDIEASKNDSDKSQIIHLKDLTNYD